MTVVNRFVQAYAHGGAMKPTLQVVHSAETPLKAGYAFSIASNWFAKSAAGTSANFMVDPVEIIRMLSDNVVAYAVGPKANGFTLSWEQAGYARFSRAEWTTPDGMKQMDLLAAGLRERGLANGIPLRWASDDDIRAAARGVPGGICFHDDIRRVLGGTTHVDPMPAYPRDLLMARVQSTAPTLTDWFDMATKEDLLAVLRSEGISGAGDAKTMLDRGYRQAYTDALTAVLRTEGVSGAGDTGRIATAVAAAVNKNDAAALAAAIPANIAQQVATELSKRLAS